MLSYRAPFVLERPDEVWFDCNLMQKDLQLALEAGRRHDVPMLTTAVANELMTTARGLGLDRNDFAIVHEVIAQLSGMPKAVA
jgi:3-hydroxyisobutyrate dehydrogenase-like beta-hydroxyacid dehydrogenase